MPVFAAAWKCLRATVSACERKGKRRAVDSQPYLYPYT